MNIITITLNPAYDIHAYTEQFVPFKENLAKITSRDAGGKGINISRALNAVGIENTAVIALGSENSGEFKEKLILEGVKSIIFEMDGRIRENITIHSVGSSETRISFSGFSVDESILSKIERKLDINGDTIVTFTGRIPNGIAVEKVIDFLKRLQQQGAKLVIDSKSISLSDIFALKPWLIKPNEEEISEYFGEDISTLALAEQKAKEIANHGIDNVIVSLGEKGALLISNGETYKVAPPKVKVISTIGAGDSTIAGFISEYISGSAPYTCLKKAVSFGTAACLTVGTAPPLSKDIVEIYNKIK